MSYTVIFAKLVVTKERNFELRFFEKKF